MTARLHRDYSETPAAYEHMRRSCDADPASQETFEPELVSDRVQLFVIALVGIASVVLAVAKWMGWQS